MDFSSEVCGLFIVDFRSLKGKGCIFNPVNKLYSLAYKV